MADVYDKTPKRQAAVIGRDATIRDVPVTETEVATRPAYQAYTILHVAFALAPFIAGADKFFNILTNWEKYLAPVVPRVTGLLPVTFMEIVGVIEMVAAIGVILKPRIFAYVVSAWMVGIIVNLLVLGNYFDIALRDLGLCLGAFALGRLATTYDRHDVTAS